MKLLFRVSVFNLIIRYTIMEATLLEKEHIEKIQFAEKEVLVDRESQAWRNWHLERAVILGNGYKGKVNIYFQDKDGNNYVVNTTIWSAGDKYIMLKGGRVIPMHAITKIEF